MAEKLDFDFGRKLIIDSNVTICTICLKSWIPRRPKILPCSHTFCSKCLENYISCSVSINRNNNKFDCPNCRIECILPAGGVDSLQTNSYFVNASSIGNVSAKFVSTINDNENQLLNKIESQANDMKNYIEKEKRQLKDSIKEKFEELKSNCWLLEEELNDSKTPANEILLKFTALVERSKKIKFEPNPKQGLLGSIKGESEEKYNNSDRKEEEALGFNFPIRPPGREAIRNFYYGRRWRIKDRKLNRNRGR